MDSDSAEVYAIPRACQLLVSNQSYSHHNISIISDSSRAVSWINGSDFGNLRLFRLIQDIRRFKLSWEGISIKVTPRETNSLADSLAKNGSAGCGDRLEWGA